MKLKPILALSIATTALAQNEPKIAELRDVLTEYQTEYAEQAERVELLVSELKKMDMEIESGIAKTLAFAKRYTDSAETRERIMKSKTSIIKDLMRSIEHYLDLQEDLTREIAQDRTYLKEDAIAIRQWADEKITLRVRQITEITTSLGGYDIYSQGIAYHVDNYDYEREKHLAEEAVKEKTDMIKQMREGVKELKKRGESLERELTNVRSHRSVTEINRELKMVNEKITLLEDSIDEIFAAEPEGKRVGRNASREIEKELRNQVNELKASSDSFFKNFDALLTLLRKQKSTTIHIEKYEFAIEQLTPESAETAFP